MKRIIAVTLSSALFLGITAVSPASTDAAAKSYKNCTELNKAYKGGVAKDAKVKNKGGKTKYKPVVSADLYKANSSKDRDKDGIACER
ncbi:excalibur calcium-binding domain-containing protein [Domibacillus indicus]|uniref:excalibur calcium-binding domain-containing protein n=1 Tax=Domibacillus indicus TaxID=1437523 RepID=UPI000617BE70|nr:excalibur calcium-binding domain-containing protein [Domibacillus indicus]